MSAGRKFFFIVSPTDLREIALAVLGGAFNDFWLAEHGTIWTTTEDPEGVPVDLVILRQGLRVPARSEPVQ